MEFNLRKIFQLITLIWIFILIFPSLLLAQESVKKNIEVMKTNIYFDECKSIYNYCISLKNNSTKILSSPIKIILKKKSTNNFIPANPEGVTSNGNFYYLIEESLHPNKCSEILNLQFINTKNFSHKKTSSNGKNNNHHKKEKYTDKSPKLESLKEKGLPFGFSYEIIYSTPKNQSIISKDGGQIEILDPESPIYGAKIIFPDGSLEKDTTVAVEHKINHKPIIGDYKQAGPVIDIDLGNENLTGEIYITYIYNDNDNNGIIDNTDISEKDLLLVKFDEDTLRWEKLETYNQNYELNTFTAVTSHLCEIALVKWEEETDSGIEILTIDGLSFDKVILSKASEIIEKAIDSSDIAATNLQEYLVAQCFQWYIKEKLCIDEINAEIDELRTSYTYNGIVNLRREFDDFEGKVKESDINTVCWCGDAWQTSDVIDKITKYIEDIYYESVTKKKEKGQKPDKFIVIGHSWGTMLLQLALQKCDSEVRVDRIITLSNPNGAGNVHYNSANNFLLGFSYDDLPDWLKTLISAYDDNPLNVVGNTENTVRGILSAITVDHIEAVIENFTQGRIEEVEINGSGMINGGDWYNIWLNGDIISGPIGHNDVPMNIRMLDDQYINNIKWSAQGNDEARSVSSTAYCHALTSMDAGVYIKALYTDGSVGPDSDLLHIPGKWDDYEVHQDDRDFAKEKVKNLILELIDAEGDGIQFFYEDWENGYIDSTKWVKGGSPQPIIVNEGHNDNHSVNNNGDNWCYSALYTNSEFPIADGLSTAFWLKCNGNGVGRLNMAGLTANQMENSTNSQYCAGEGYYKMAARVRIHGDRQTTQYIIGSVEDGKTIASKTVDLFDNEWHKFKIDITSEGQVKFYRDGILVFAPSDKLDSSNSTSFRFQHFGKACVDDMLCDNITISTLSDNNFNRNLIAHWSFDNPFNLGRDDPGNGHWGTVIGTEYYDNGAVNGALELTSANDGIEVPHSPDFHTSSMSIAFWIKKNDDQRGVILAKDI